MSETTSKSEYKTLSETVRLWRKVSLRIKTGWEKGKASRKGG